MVYIYDCLVSNISQNNSPSCTLVSILVSSQRACQHCTPKTVFFLSLLPFYHTLSDPVRPSFGESLLLPLLLQEGSPAHGPLDAEALFLLPPAD